MRTRPRLALFALASFLLSCPSESRGQEPSPAQLTFEELLRKLSSAPANACDDFTADLSDVEFRLFQRADEAVAQALNANAGTASPQARALPALQTLERLSAEINKSWPEGNRFHFNVLDLPPAVVVTMRYRNRAGFSFFGTPERGYDKQTGNIWRSMGALHDHKVTPGGGYDSFELFPLARGPSTRVRFLSKFVVAGCGSGVAVGYYAYEWNPQGVGDLREFIRLDGAVSQLDSTDVQSLTLKDPEGSFVPTGELRTQGTRITLPYCWFSALDTWNNPNLCAVNTYDLSGDSVRFVSTTYNRPDLLPVAKAIEYAQAHDYPAVLAYCASPAVAQRLVRDIPTYVSGVVDFRMERIGELRKRVFLGGDPTYRFDVEKRGDRWLVVAFHAE